MKKYQSKTDKYKRLYNQLSLLLDKSPSVQAQMATVNAILYYKIDYIFWIGFYIINNKILTVGPYQGPLACQILDYPSGACWYSILNKKIVNIPDVSKFPGHIPCDSRSKSELVIPLLDNSNNIYAVLDIDSDKLNAFDIVDEKGISEIVKLIRS
ncbi:MAG: GAF domain-containing protein [Bacteroidales bacterium]|nr:GAF domain-containing protein [Bacteroidales bacterium]